MASLQERSDSKVGLSGLWYACENGLVNYGNESEDAGL